MESTRDEMVARHYRDEWGNCAYCMTSDGYEGESVEWPCDTAVLLKDLGYTLREDAPYEAPPVDPNAPITAETFIPALWNLQAIVERERKLFSGELPLTLRVVDGDTINIPQVRNLELRA